MAKILSIKNFIKLFVLSSILIFLFPLLKNRTVIILERKISKIVKSKLIFFADFHSLRISKTGAVKIKRVTFFKKSSRISHYRLEFSFRFFLNYPIFRSGLAIAKNFKKLVSKFFSRLRDSSFTKEDFSLELLEELAYISKQLKHMVGNVDRKITSRCSVAKIIFSDATTNFAIKYCYFSAADFKLHVSDFRFKALNNSADTLGSLGISELNMENIVVNLIKCENTESELKLIVKCKGGRFIFTNELKKYMVFGECSTEASLHDSGELACNLHFRLPALSLLSIHIQYYISGLISFRFIGTELDLFSVVNHMDSLVYKEIYEKMFKGILTGFQGNLAFEINNPNKVLFKFNFDEKFNPVSIPEVDRIQNSFHYDVKRTDGHYKTIDISNSNKNFQSLACVPELLRTVIILSEDKSFFQHQGIDYNAIGKAAVQNFLKMGITRGGSTITMQVVKNIFFNEDKTFSRKFEEIVITDYIERVLILPKTRILEIYLNIIQFAPNVYGIDEGAQFYFEKEVQNLSILECIILSYIIPRPTYFLSALMENSTQLRTNLGSHVKITANRLNNLYDYKIEIDELINSKIVIKKIMFSLFVV